ncbi:MAG TPA: hypothetical protein VL137_18700 [Polyangiaceae bacterium]|nr:hypothetical protein [Polyangiaceae bacterium]
MIGDRGYCVTTLLIAAFCLSVAPNGRAQEPAPANSPQAEPGAAADPEVQQETALLRYQAPGSCPDRSEFIRRVQRYTTKATFTAQGPGENTSSRTFVLTIDQEGNQFGGALVIQQRTASAARSVSGKSCDEVTDALALMTALAIDPSVLGAGPEQPPATPTKKQPAAKPRKKHRGKEHTAPDRAQWSLGALGLALPGLFPNVAWGGAALVELRTSIVAAVRPTFALGASYLDGGHQKALGATVHYAALNAEAQGCAEVALSQQWAPALCVGSTVGRTSSRTNASPTTGQSSGARTWAALLLGLRLDWNFDSSATLRLEGAAGSHLLEQRVTLVGVDPNGQEHQTLLNDTRGLVGRVALGLFVHL